MYIDDNDDNSDDDDSDNDHDDYVSNKDYVVWKIVVFEVFKKKDIKKKKRN